MSSPTVWCPSCGAEYQAGSLLCSDCRVALVSTPPSSQPGTVGAWGVRAEQTSDDDLMELGSWPRLPAQILRRRLESAGLSVMVEWTGPGPEAEGTIVVPASQAEFARRSSTSSMLTTRCPTARHSRTSFVSKSTLPLPASCSRSSGRASTSRSATARAETGPAAAEATPRNPLAHRPNWSAFAQGRLECSRTSSGIALLRARIAPM